MLRQLGIQRLSAPTDSDATLEQEDIDAERGYGSDLALGMRIVGLAPCPCPPQRRDRERGPTIRLPHCDAANDSNVGVRCELVVMRLSLSETAATIGRRSCASLLLSAH